MPGNTANKRTELERERDLATIAKLYLRGLTQFEISLKLAQEHGYKLTRQQISYDLKELHKRWLESSMVHYNEIKARELARIDKLEQASWDGWENSLKRKEKTQIEDVQDTYAGAQAANSYKRKKGKKTIEERDGDARFLDKIAWCINQRCKIFGLYAPEQQVVDISWREEARKAGLNPEQAQEDLVAQFLAAANTPVGRADDERGMGRSSEED